MAHSEAHRPALRRVHLAMQEATVRIGLVVGPADGAQVPGTNAHRLRLIVIIVGGDLGRCGHQDDQHGEDSNPKGTHIVAFFIRR